MSAPRPLPDFAYHVYDEVEQILTGWQRDGIKTALVPTMGALHEGHLSLIEVARAHADKVIVTIFVNPTQFGPNEDFDTYPRTVERDLDLLAGVGADLVWLPQVEAIYPQGFETEVRVKTLSQVLDGASRPGFFDGIATVVSRLFLMLRPNAAVFGEKDYQQLLVIKRMATDLHLPIEIVGAPIKRDHDGLALSSRNAYLSPEERQIAGQLNVIMRRTIETLLDGAPMDQALQQGREALESAGLAPVDYWSLWRVPSLTPLAGDVSLAKPDQGRTRLFAAVMLGKTRLIDNMSVGEVQT